MHPALQPALRRVWRDPVTLQLGLDPSRSTVIGGISPPVARLLGGLDGSRSPARAVADLCAAPDRSAARELLTLLAQGGCLDATPPAHCPPELRPDLAALTLRLGGSAAASAALARRRTASVVVDGAGRVGAPLAALLAAAGVGRVCVVDPGPATGGDVAPAGIVSTDVGRPRAGAVARRLRRPGRLRAGAETVDPGGDTPGRGNPPDLVVLAPIGPGTPDPLQAAELVRRGIPHLALGVRETTGWIGPLVLPGRGACLGCVERHRTERDPAWPAVAAQLAVPAYGTVDACDVALSALVAALAAAQALLLLDAAPGALPDGLLRGTLGGTIETEGSDARIRRRSWAPHPECPCRDEVAPADVLAGHRRGAGAESAGPSARP